MSKPLYRDGEHVHASLARAKLCAVGVEAVPEGQVAVEVLAQRLAVQPHERVVMNAFEVHPRRPARPRGWQREMLALPTAAVVDQVDCVDCVGKILVEATAPPAG